MSTWLIAVLWVASPETIASEPAYGVKVSQVGFIETVYRGIFEQCPTMVVDTVPQTEYRPSQNGRPDARTLLTGGRVEWRLSASSTGEP